MYRLNRIGPYPILDLDRSAITWPAAWTTATNWNLADAAQTARAPHFRSATVRDDQDHVTWNAAIAMALADANAISFGVAISGSIERPMHFQGHASLVGSHGAALECNIWCGRLDAATVSVDYGAAANNVPYWYNLACSKTQVIQVDWNGSFLVVDEDDDGFGTYPFVLGATILNNTGGAATIEGMQCSLSLMRYVSDYDTLDPSR